MHLYKKLLSIFLLLLSLNLYGAAAEEFTRPDGIRCHVLMPGEATAEEYEGFYRAFEPAYASLTAEELDVVEREATTRAGTHVTGKAALLESLTWDLNDIGKPGVYCVNLRTADGKLAGYVGIENYNETAEGSTFPKDSAYVRQLYVVPGCARKGIARWIMTDVVSHFVPHLKRIFVATRTLNKPAIDLYETLGYTQITEENRALYGLPESNLHNLPAKSYVSFVWNKPLVAKE